MSDVKQNLISLNRAPAKFNRYSNHASSKDGALLDRKAQGSGLAEGAEQQSQTTKETN